MKLNMCLRCVVLFTVFPFGLITSLDHIPPGEDNATEDLAQNDLDLETGDPVTNLKTALLFRTVYSNCIDFIDTEGNSEFSTSYGEAVSEVEQLLAEKDVDFTDDARANLITATKAMVVGEPGIRTDEHAVNRAWSSYRIDDDRKKEILEEIEKMVNKFIDDLKKC